MLLRVHLFLLFIDKVIGVQGACQPPEYSSRKACDEEHATSGFACRRRRKYNIFLKSETPNGAKPQEAHRTPRGKRAPGAEINRFQELQIFREHP
jgi:hypothetical protein